MGCFGICKGGRTSIAQDLFLLVVISAAHSDSYHCSSLLYTFLQVSEGRCNVIVEKNGFRRNRWRLPESLVEREQTEDHGGHDDHDKDREPSTEHIECCKTIISNVLCYAVSRKLGSNFADKVCTDRDRNRNEYERNRNALKRSDSHSLSFLGANHR